MWRAFQRVNPALDHPFLSFAFAFAASKVNDLVRIGVLQRDGQAIGFLPFQFASDFDRILGAAEPIALSDHFALVTSPDVFIAPEQLLDSFGLSAMQFRHLGADLERTGLAGNGKEIGLRLPLTGSETCSNQLKVSNREFASQLERKERAAVRKLGELRFSFKSEDTTFELERIIGVKRQQYKRTNVRDSLSEPWRVGFLKSLFDNSDASCTPVLSTLYAGDTWLASHLGLLSERILHQWFPVYSMEHSSYSAGHILTKRMLDHAQAMGVTSFDFGGFGDYKLHFRPERYEMTSGSWTKSNVSSFVSRVKNSVRWRIRSAVGSYGRWASRERNGTNVDAV